VPALAIARDFPGVALAPSVRVGVTIMSKASTKVFGFLAITALAGCVGDEYPITNSWPKKYSGATEEEGAQATAPSDAKPTAQPTTREVKVQICDASPIVDATYGGMFEQSLAAGEGGSSAASAPSVSEIVVTKSDASNETAAEYLTLKVNATSGAETTPLTILCPPGVAPAAPSYRVQIVDDAGPVDVDTTAVRRIEEMKIAIAADGTQTISDIVIVFDAREAAGAPVAGTTISARIDRLPRASTAAVPGAAPGEPTALSTMTLAAGTSVASVEDIDELGVPVRKLTLRATKLRGTIEGLPH
jgi:hypothetical protein